MVVRTRFAPSPTGRLHLGHALAARIAHALARRNDSGVFLLRHEDIDGPRVRDEFYQNIEGDLKWLGLQWDEVPLRQATRTNAYEEALSRLHEKGLVYPCFCTRKEIQNEWANMAAAPQGPDGPIYPGTCREIPLSAQHEKIAANIPHAWRLHSSNALLETGPLTFYDSRFGKIDVKPELLGDVVLARKDIGTAYHLAVVLDDAFQGITHVTRGEDLLPSTHVHRLLQVLLDLPEPVYLHHPLMLDESGKRLAKRNDALSIATLRESGHNAAALLDQCDAVFDISAITI
ncbi:MAG: tRNA glutamyl-Q(34) synthetase GluQRS [Gloeobacteraceae cyanobacterium ES-bin-144]|nr:tRNA glutamyl-Q(34) synthetase GluQRS [Verrucomicrobiales bacterium]